MNLLIRNEILSGTKKIKQFKSINKTFEIKKYFIQKSYTGKELS